MLERLRALPLFADLDDDQLATVAAATSEFAAPAGRPLIERGEPGSGLFVLEEGICIVEVPGGDLELEPGAVFGERALVGGAHRSARVRAETDVRCLAIPRVEIERLLRANPGFAERLRDLAS